MSKKIPVNERMEKNKEQFHNELKIFVNQKLYEKKLISEDMYWSAKDFLLKHAS